MVILAWTGPELSREQASDWYTHRHTDAGNDNTWRPKLAPGKKPIIFSDFNVKNVTQLHSAVNYYIDVA